MPDRIEPSRETRKRRDRLVEIAASLPEVDVAGDPHLTFKVRKKVLAYYCFDHHGDGRIALWCKAGPGEQGRLVEDDPRRFFVPPYVGVRGWVGLRLDTRKVNWAEVAYLLKTSYRLTAPRTLLIRLQEDEVRR